MAAALGERAGDGAAGAGGLGFPVQSIQRQDVALTLKITPQINEGDAVLLEIDQEVSSLASSIIHYAFKLLAPIPIKIITI